MRSIIATMTLLTRFFSQFLRGFAACAAKLHGASPAFPAAARRIHCPELTRCLEPTGA